VRARRLLPLAVAGAWAAPAAAPVCRPLAEAFRIPCRLDGGGIALTFDDGPHPEGTPAILDALAAADAVATFFLVGEQVERHPEVARAVADAGHEIALHGFRHTLLLRRRTGELAADLARAATLIEDVTGATPRLYRPPYGVFSLGGLLHARRRWRPLLWSQWGRDWTRSATPASVARLSTRTLSGGDVILLHDADHYSVRGSWRATAGALPAILEACQATGEPFVRASDDARTQST
jgi:peptidoglycan/xylan/chitin deacetylase (PgdA/CDA1 family)